MVEASGRLITPGDLISLKFPKTFSAVFPEIILPKTFSAFYLWKSNLNEITGNHANENYE